MEVEYRHGLQDYHSVLNKALKSSISTWKLYNSSLFNPEPASTLTPTYSQFLFSSFIIFSGFFFIPYPVFSIVYILDMHTIIVSIFYSLPKKTRKKQQCKIISFKSLLFTCFHLFLNFILFACMCLV